MDNHTIDVDRMIADIECYLKAFDSEMRYKQASFETLAVTLRRVSFTIMDEKALRRVSLARV